jgi:hypothetical protein
VSGSAGQGAGADLPVLHALRCTGHTVPERVAEVTGLPVAEAESRLIDLAVAGLADRTPGPFGGWGLTGAGRAEDDRLTAAELAASGARPVVERAYRDFMVLNPELLDLCTAWQLRPGSGAAAGERGDPVHEARVLARFADLHRRTEPVLAELSGALLRFGRYGDRLGRALARARSGATEYLTDGMDSYHSVWFQLHEDLLVTLGMPRH